MSILRAHGFESYYYASIGIIFSSFDADVVGHEIYASVVAHDEFGGFEEGGGLSKGSVALFCLNVEKSG